MTRKAVQDEYKRRYRRIVTLTECCDRGEEKDVHTWKWTRPFLQRVSVGIFPDIHEIEEGLSARGKKVRR